MAEKKSSGKPKVSEEFQIQTQQIIRKFKNDGGATTYEFPKTLTTTQRAWIHDYARTSGLSSKSYGSGSQRYITIGKRKIKTTRDSILLNVSDDSVKAIEEFLSKNLSTGENLSVVKSDFKKASTSTDSTICQWSVGSPKVPHFGVNKDLLSSRMNLPIWTFREDIINKIVTNQVLIITAETGSGKTTQVPQFILDYSASVGEKCRIVCTQPRRISTVAIAERVAFERGDVLGQSVGFQIRLESCVGNNSTLIYCTNGILLRALINGDSCLKSITHIIVDEIHERDRYTDFLLTSLRECLVNYPNLRLILMSATVDPKPFSDYFNNAFVMKIPGRLFEVQEYFLEDILQMLKYQSRAMEKLEASEPISSTKTIQKDTSPDYEYTLDEDLKNEMDQCIADCEETGTEDDFAQLLQMILSEGVPVDFQHTKTGITPLMVAAMNGFQDVVHQLLNLGANMNLTSKDGNAAGDWARIKNQTDMVKYLQDYTKYLQNNNSEAVFDGTTYQNSSKKHLELYQRTVSDQIDFNLLETLLLSIHNNEDFFSILIFLPGYEDILTMKNRITSTGKFCNKPFQLFTLHSLMPIKDQHQVFKPLKNKRKIILSTNIAETSITIDDVVYVIDTGKVKEKCYDAMSGVCTLETRWISQSCGKQRAGRAGRIRPGICYHLISRMRFESLEIEATPMILRMPLHELCLQTKLLAPKEIKIMDFLSRCMDPPSSWSVSSAVSHLQDIDALDENEELTILGRHLVDFPVPPNLAKMIIYAVIYKCLDPILTLVALLSYRDPFVLPISAAEKKPAALSRKEFSASAYSDHMALLKVFLAWQDARLQHKEREFCQKKFVNSGAMEMAMNIRSQLLGQLRVSGFIHGRAPYTLSAVNVNSDKWAVVKAVLAAGFYPNFAYIDLRTSKIITKNEKSVVLHASSVLRDSTESKSKRSTQYLKKIPSEWIVYEEMSRFGAVYNIRGLTSISSLTVSAAYVHVGLVSGLEPRRRLLHCQRFIFSCKGLNQSCSVDLCSFHAAALMTSLTRADKTLAVKKPTTRFQLGNQAYMVALLGEETSTVVSAEDSTSENESPEQEDSLTLNGWIKFESNTKLIRMIRSVRRKLESYVIDRIKNPTQAHNTDESILKLIVQILPREDTEIGLCQPVRFGDRPRVLTQNNYTDVLGRRSNELNWRRTPTVVPDCLKFNAIRTRHYNKYMPSSHEELDTNNMIDSKGPNRSSREFSKRKISKLRDTDTTVSSNRHESPDTHKLKMSEKQESEASTPVQESAIKTSAPIEENFELSNPDETVMCEAANSTDADVCSRQDVEMSDLTEIDKSILEDKQPSPKVVQPDMDDSGVYASPNFSGKEMSPRPDSRVSSPRRDGKRVEVGAGDGNEFRGRRVFISSNAKGSYQKGPNRGEIEDSQGMDVSRRSEMDLSNRVRLESPIKRQGGERHNRKDTKRNNRHGTEQGDEKYSKGVDNYNRQDVEKNNRQEIERLNRQEVERHNRQEVERHNRQEVERHNRQEVERHNRQEVERYNRQEVERHNRQEFEKYNRQEVEKYNRQEVEKYNRQEFEKYRHEAERYRQVKEMDDRRMNQRVETSNRQDMDVANRQGVEIYDRVGVQMPTCQTIEMFNRQGIEMTNRQQYQGIGNQISNRQLIEMFNRQVADLSNRQVVDMSNRQDIELSNRQIMCNRQGGVTPNRQGSRTPTTFQDLQMSSMTNRQVLDQSNRQSLEPPNRQVPVFRNRPGLLPLPPELRSPVLTNRPVSNPSSYPQTMSPMPESGPPLRPPKGQSSYPNNKPSQVQNYSVPFSPMDFNSMTAKMRTMTLQDPSTLGYVGYQVPSVGYPTPVPWNLADKQVYPGNMTSVPVQEPCQQVPGYNQVPWYPNNGVVTVPTPVPSYPVNPANLDPTRTTFVVIVVANVEAIISAMRNNCWYFSSPMKNYMDHLLMRGRDVILLFTVSATRCFHGAARVVENIPYVNSTMYSLQWLARGNNITFESLPSLCNANFQGGEVLDFDSGAQVVNILISSS